MKSNKLNIILCLLFVLLSTTGQKCDSDLTSLFFGDNAEYTAIRDVINKFKDGINAGSQSALEAIISSQFSSAGGLDQLGMIKDCFSQELKINDIKISDIKLDGKGAEGKVDWLGTLTMRPKPDIPYVADKIPALSADVSAGFLFGFVKEDDGKWRIKAQRFLNMSKSAVWGDTPPQITSFALSKAEVNPGDSIKVNADLKKIGGNVMLASVNTKPIVNSIYGVGDGAIDAVSLTVPSDKKDGTSYDIYVMALGVDANFLNPSASKIVGISLKQISIPVTD